MAISEAQIEFKTAHASLKEELERKTYEALSSLRNRYITGFIDEIDLSFGCDVIWSVVSGLVAADLAEAMSVGMTTQPRSQRRIFVEDEKNISWTIRRQFGESSFTVLKRQGVSVIDGRSIQCDSPTEAMEKMNVFCVRLIDRGLDEL